jgi:hypothetical protein
MLFLRHQELGGLCRPERAGEVVAEVEDALHAAALEVGDELLEGGEVAVNVGEEGDFGYSFSRSWNGGLTN